MSDPFDSQFDCYVINLKTQPDKLLQFLQHNLTAKSHDQTFRSNRWDEDERGHDV
jgi:hypothetical protein